MLSPENILDRLLLVGGPPRSGTTFAARGLNSHPRIVTAIDDHVCECWALYHYPTRQGLVQDLRCGNLAKVEATERLRLHLFDGDRFSGVVPSAKSSGSSPSFLPPRPGLPAAEPMARVARHSLPLERFEADWYLCLKSPEISFVLPRLAKILDSARFILVFRPIIEIAESMYRMGNLVKKLDVFHKRWERERTEEGRLSPPPGVAGECASLWPNVTDFQRCVLYAASYVRSIRAGVESIPQNRVFLYNHARLRAHGDAIIRGLASFLEADLSGFRDMAAGIKRHVPAIAKELGHQYDEIREKMDLDELVQGIEALAERALSC